MPEGFFDTWRLNKAALDSEKGKCACCPASADVTCHRMRGTLQSHIHNSLLELAERAISILHVPTERSATLVVLAVSFAFA